MAVSYEWGSVFQIRLLALLIKDPKKSYELIEPSHFTDPILVDIARVVKNAYRGKLDSRLRKVSLLSMMRSSLKKTDKQYWKTYRKSILSVYNINLSDKDILLEQAFQFAKKAKYSDALLQTEKDISNGRFESVTKRFVELEKFGKEEKDLGIEYWKGIKKRDRYQYERGEVAPTGFKTLDGYMMGGLGGGEFGIVLAGGKVGKTTMLANFAKGAMYHLKNVAIATAELSAKKYRKRIDSLITGIPYDQISKNKRRTARLLASAHRRMKGNLYIKQFPTGKANTADIENWLDELEEQDIHIDVVLVDYVGIFRPVFSTRDRRENLGQTGVELRGIATSRNIGVWTAAQVNRGALEKETIGPSDFAEDISLFFTLDFLVAVCQTKQEREAKPPRGRFYLAAARDVGRGGVINIKMERSTFTIKESKKQPSLKDEFEKETQDAK